MCKKPIEGLPEGAKIQKGKKKNYVYLATGYTRASNQKHPYRYNTKKLYIGSIVDGNSYPIKNILRAIQAMN